MPNLQPLDIDREQVRLLVLRVGCTEAAKELGIPLNTVLSWSARGKWLKRKPDLPPTVQPRAISAIKPSQALENIMSRRKERVRDDLSRYVMNGAKVARKARNPLEVAHNVKALAGVAQAIWPEQAVPGVNINLWGSGSMQEG